MKTFLRRYTELPYIIDYLRTGELCLLNPASWDDRNDSFYIEKYARQTGTSSVYALCLADSAETYHHWRVFSHGSGGACIQFDKEAFCAALGKIKDLKHKQVEYRTIEQLKKLPPDREELPFLKRYAFCHEGEYRLFLASEQKGPPIHRISVPLSCIDRIVLSPWLPETVAKHVKETLKAIPKCSRMRVYRSTLVENEKWKKFANCGA